jgi:hypothetical protein
VWNALDIVQAGALFRSLPWLASGHNFSRATKWSKEPPALSAEELEAMEKQDTGAIDPTLK